MVKGLFKVVFFRQKGGGLWSKTGGLWHKSGWFFALLTLVSK